MLRASRACDSSLPSGGSTFTASAFSASPFRYSKPGQVADPSI
jgi:hypothetical protein